MANKIYVTYVHNAAELDTINKLLEDSLSIVVAKNKQGTGISAEELLSYTVDGKSNRDRMYAMYNVEQEHGVQNNAKNITASSPLVVGTKLLIPTDKTFKETLAVVGSNQVFPQVDQKTFYAIMHRTLLEAPGYVRASKLKNKTAGSVRQEFPEITVWMWIRALSEEDDNPDPYSSREPQGKWMDVSAFVINCDTNVTDTGGSFQLEFGPVPLYGDADGWQIEPNSVIGYTNSDIRNSHVIQTSLHKQAQGAIDRGALVRNHFLFHHLIQQNDLVFIRFETLELESTQRANDSRKFQLSSQDIPGRIYDMVGLVDTVSIRTNSANSDVTCTVSGRDFVKSIIDDGTYFYATPAHDLSGLNQGDGLVQRLTANGKYPIMAEYAFRSIQWSLQWLMNQIAGLSVVPDSVFEGYGDRRIKKYKIENDQKNGKDQYKPTFSDENAKGIWQIIRLAVDSQVASRRLADNSLAYPDGSLINQFWKICQKPFVEFFTDTYGDQFYFIVRQPPLTKSHVVTLLRGRLSDITSSEIKDHIDNSIANPKNPEALDQRKKPRSIMVGEVELVDTTQPQELDEVSIKIRKTQEYIVSIEEADIISDDLSFNNDPCYSFYEIIPSGPLVGTNETFVIHFEEYAQIYGSKRLSQECQYVPYEAYSSYNEDKRKNYIAEQIANDLIYLIESNAYLPFTRRGTITLNGDRRIKKGTWIRHRGTREIYYVTGVQQTYRIGSEIDRETILTVERGMVEAFVSGGQHPYEGTTVDISYFNLIDLELVKNVFVTFLTGDLAQNAKYNQELQQRGAVNKKVFTFFQKRRQFIPLINHLKSSKTQ